MEKGTTSKKINTKHMEISICHILSSKGKILKVSELPEKPLCYLYGFLMKFVI